jgi:hypothetical protein
LKTAAMKNLLFVLPLFATASALAQNKPSADTTSINGLPVLRSYVAPDVVERAKKKYGRSLYCIETSKAENCENSYLVGILRNKRLNMEWMCDDPKMVQGRKKIVVKKIAG